MTNNDIKPKQNELLASYQAVNQHWAHAEQERWSVLYNFLTANMILILAWCAIYSSQILWRWVVLLTLSFAGFVFSILWLTISSRVNVFIKHYGQLGEQVESALHLTKHGPFHTGEKIRTDERSSTISRDALDRLASVIPSRIFVLVVPLLFSLVYIILFILSSPCFLKTN